MFATTLRSSPAASINSASTLSVTVERMPADPRAASSSSARAGGPSASTATSKPRRSRRPASGITRVTSTLPGIRLLPIPDLIFLFEHLAQHGLEDAAVTEVLDFDRGVHARLDLELFALAFVASSLHGQLLAGLEVGEA